MKEKEKEKELCPITMMIPIQTQHAHPSLEKEKKKEKQLPLPSMVDLASTSSINFFHTYQTCLKPHTQLCFEIQNLMKRKKKKMGAFTSTRMLQ